VCRGRESAQVPPVSETITWALRSPLPGIVPSAWSCAPKRTGHSLPLTAQPCDRGPETVDYAIFCGPDVGKGTHHAVALDPTGQRVSDRELPQDQARLRELSTGLLQHGNVLVVVDQPATIGALPIAVARAVGAEVAYPPGLAMRGIADLHPGSAKTDTRTRSSSPMPPGPCPAPCAGSTSARTRWPNRPYRSGPTTTRPPNPPG
jgi:hypothetical protein